MPKDMIIEKSVVINKPKKDIYDYLKNIRNQDEFSIWNMTDPNQKVATTGTDGTVGFIYSWDSQNKNVGAGSQEITLLIPNERIDCDLRFERPMKNVAKASFVLEEISKKETKVSWTFRGPTKFPMSLFSFIFKKMLGKDMAKSMDNLKAKMEA